MLVCNAHRLIKTILSGLVELRRIETAEEITGQMAASRNVVYLPQGQQTLLSLPQQ